MIVLLAVALAVSLPFVAVLVARPVERRLALRYPRRRPVEAGLVVLGSLLGTAIITGSLVVGNTINRSIRASAYDQLGPVDEVVATTGLEAGDTLAARFAGFSAPSIDGVLRIDTAQAAVRGTLAQPRAQIVEVDFAAARAFGHDPSITGLEGPTPAPGRVAITRDLAARTAVHEGDHLEVFAFGRSVDVIVDRIFERRGIAGFWRLDRRQQAYNVLVAPGFLAQLTAGETTASAADSEPPTSYVAFSNVGGVEDAAARTDAAVAAIDGRLAGSAERVQPVKRDLLTTADDAAGSLTQLYFTMGMFAVSAGILLLVNIFVMLSDDRRSELGMLRALGLRRVPLVAAFATEGWIYSLVASALGAIAGIGVGRVIAWRADQILGRGDEVFRLDLTFAFTWSTVLEGFVIGLVISMVTIVATSARVSRLNVIAAIRELPAIHRRKPRRRWMRAGQIAMVLGAAWTVISVAGGATFGVILGPVLVLVGAGPVLARRLPGREVITGVSVAVLVWGAVFIAALAALNLDVTIPVFLVQGLTMAAAAVALVSVYQAQIGHAVARVTGRSLPIRVGLAYPIARKFRTAMTLAMFAIVVLTLVYLSIISFMFRNQRDEITADASGGFGMVVTSNPTNPVTAEQLTSTTGVRAVAPLAYGQADFVADGDAPKTWPLTGFGAELAAAPPALKDTGRYDSAIAAWNAVSADPGLIIVDPFFLRSGGGPPSALLDVGDTVTIIDPVSGNTRVLTVAALAKGDFVNSGAWYGMGGYQTLFGARAVPSRFYVASDDPTRVAATIRTEFLGNGADAEAVKDRVAGILSQNTGFFTLMEQFVGVGLIVGIAGIGVLLVRAVRERRRDIGVLRSLGFQPGWVSRAFLVEAGFIAIEGVVIGIVVALIGSYGLVASGVDFATDFTWGVPWVEVAVIAAIALVTSAVVALWPARRASHIRPAVALRIVD